MSTLEAIVAAHIGSTLHAIGTDTSLTTHGADVHPGSKEFAYSCNDKNAMGIIMTGMGNDGATGLLSMRKAGALTIGQDEPSCVVYGMPRAAVALGAVDQSIPLDQMPAAITRTLAKLPL